MKIYCTNTLIIVLWIVVAILPYFIFPNSFVFFTIFNTCLLFFLNNSLKVYIFEEKGFKLRYRLFRKNIIYVNYEELDNITFSYVISPHSSHRIDFSTKKKIERILPTISMQNWNEVEDLITFFKDKDVRLIINK